MTVSVLVLAYNQERHVAEALDSVAAQTYDDLEVLITDDCSTDGTLAAIRDWVTHTGFRARVIANERNLGICRVLNNALAVTTGEFVCGFAADDVMAPDRVARQVAVLTSSPPEVAAVASDMRVIDPNGAVLQPSYLNWLGLRSWPRDSELFALLLFANIVPAPAVMVRRAALEAVGPYDETLVFEDYDMWLRLADRFSFRFLPGVVVDYRMDPFSLSHSTERRVTMLESEMRLLLKWVGRSPATDRIIAEHLMRIGREMQALDPALAHRAFVNASHVSAA